MNVAAPVPVIAVDGPTASGKGTIAAGAVVCFVMTVVDSQQVSQSNLDKRKDPECATNASNKQ